MLITELEFGKGGANIVTFTRDTYGRSIKKRIKHTHYIYEEDNEGKYKTLFGTQVKRKYFKKFWEVKTYLKTCEKPTYEDDISYTKRFNLDHYDEVVGPGKPRVLMYDIETTGFSSTDDQIISIVAHDSFNNVYYEFLWAPEFEECNSERKMLLEFAKVIKNVDPDILTGWNSDRFDLPFVVDRMDHHNVPTTLLSRLNQKVEPYHTNQGEVYRIRGRIVIDYLEAYKKLNIAELGSYSLDNVAHKELGVGKNEISELPGQLWENKDYKTLLQYNRRDVQILVELDKKLELIAFLNKLAEITCSPFEDGLYNSRLVDNYILSKTCKQGIILPSRKFNNKRSDYKGGYVQTPHKGIHENVGIFDASSLYPSIIISFNISNETFTDNWMDLEPGLIPSLLDELLDLRKEYRSKGLDKEQKVIKTLINSFYGVMGLPSFRLYDQRLAAEVTRRGREIIQFTIGVVNNDLQDKIDK